MIAVASYSAVELFVFVLLDGVVRHPRVVKLRSPSRELVERDVRTSRFKVFSVKAKYRIHSVVTRLRF